MINFVLFKRNLKNYYMLLLIFCAILLMYLYIITNMYNPEDLNLLNKLAELKLSPELLSAMGFELTDTSLTGFISSYYYGMLMLAFPMIFEIILANGLVCKIVDNGNISSILSTPMKRKTFIQTQLIFLFTFIFVLILFVTVSGIVISKYLFNDLLNVSKFLQINLMILLIHFAIGSICFLFSSLFNETKNSLLFGTGIPVIFLLINMLYNMDKSNTLFKYLTIFSLFNPLSILKGNSYLIQANVLILIIIILSFLSINIFNKKDLNV